VLAKQVEQNDPNARHFARRAFSDMTGGNSDGASIFPLETSFHKKTGRPGGIPREQALRNARMQVMRLFVRCAWPAADVRAIPVRVVPLRRASPRTGYLAMASGFRFD
jgi:hypothetical protein